MLGTLELGVLLTNENSVVPTKAHDGDLCYDFYSCEDVDILPGITKVVDLGVRLCLPEGYGLVLKERSGLATKGVLVGAGVIDNGYRGELKAVIRWMPADGKSQEPFQVKKGSKIVQGMLVRVVDMPVVQLSVNEFDTDDSERKEGGFGSTGD